MTDEVSGIQESWDKIKESKNSDMEKVLELEDNMKKAEEDVQEEEKKLDMVMTTTTTMMMMALLT